MKKIISALIVSMFLFSCSQGVVDEKQEAQAPAVQKEAPVNPHEGMSTDDAQEDPHANVKKERKVNVPASVTDKYKSLIVEVKNKKENTTVQADILIGQKAEVTGTPFTIEIEYYLPDFVIDTDGTITTRTADEKNPVAKIKVYKFNEVFFDGWLFKEHPDEHGSFKDELYSISIVKSLLK